MGEYIEREAVLCDIEEGMKFRGLGRLVGTEMKRYIKRQPAADVVEAVHGRWLNPRTPKRYGGGLVCSECKKTADWTYNFCPNCGARMDGEA